MIFIKRIISLFLAILLAAGMITLSSCEKKDEKKNEVTSAKNEESPAYSVEIGDGIAVITCNIPADGDTLYDVMEALSNEGELDFEFSSGMLISIGDVKNKEDFSACWMLYTSDTEMSSAEWGCVEYNGETYASAVVGAEELAVIPGGVYVWSYQTF